MTWLPDFLRSRRSASKRVFSCLETFACEVSSFSTSWPTLHGPSLSSRRMRSLVVSDMALNMRDTRSSCSRPSMSLFSLGVEGAVLGLLGMVLNYSLLGVGAIQNVFIWQYGHIVIFIYSCQIMIN